MHVSSALFAWDLKLHFLQQQHIDTPWAAQVHIIVYPLKLCLAMHEHVLIRLYDIVLILLAERPFKSTKSNVLAFDNLQTGGLHEWDQTIELSCNAGSYCTLLMLRVPYSLSGLQG